MIGFYSRSRSIVFVGLAGLTFGLSAPAHGQSVDDSADTSELTLPPDLLDTPLEDLLTLESTSVAKKRQLVSEATSAVYVIGHEEIQSSSAQTIPDLLRGVPGLEVGRVTNGGYAVTIRGFNSRLANSLLVMVDGRSQFVSTLSGVFWDQLMIPFNDIERIEIVRGPGSSLWGANSSNGVINIITKHSASSGGVFVDGRVSTRFQQGSVSYGGRVSDDLLYRIYGSARHDNGMVDETGDDVGRRWIGGAAGLRVDWEPDDRNAYTFQADFAKGAYDIPFALVSRDLLKPGYIPSQSEDRFTTFSVLGRYAKQHNDAIDSILQVQYNRIDRVELGGANFVWQLADLDLGVRWRVNDRHDINFGVGARLLFDTVSGPDYAGLSPSSATDRWLSGYIQDEITLVPDVLRLTLGTKLEHNNFTGFEVQPSARLFVRPSRNISLWAAVSRAVRTPSRMERAANFSFQVELPGTAMNPYPLPVYPNLIGLPERRAERLIAYEAGARFDMDRGWSLDVTGYYNDYSRLTAPTPTTVEALFQAPAPYPVGLRLNLDLAGSGKAETWGAEASLSGHIAPWWKVGLNYSYFDYTVGVDPLTGGQTMLLFPLEGSPRHQAALTNAIDISSSFSINSQVRYTSRRSQGPVPAYTALDLRLTYRLLNGAEFSLVGTDLLKARHAEFIQPIYPTPLTLVPRTVSAQLRYRF